MRLVTYKAAVARGRRARTSPARSRWPAGCAPSKGMQIGLDGVQLLGGHGFVKEHPVERWYRDLRAIGDHGRRGAGLMINLDDPKKFRPLLDQAHQVAMNMLRPISRKYDRAEHEYPKELDMLAAMIDGLSESGASPAAPARPAYARDGADGDGRRRRQERRQPGLGAVDHGDVLGRRRPAAVDAAPGPRQLRDRVGRQRRAARALRAACGPAMAITEPGTGSDSANIQTTAVLDGDEYVINGEKIYVTAGERCRRASWSGRPSTSRWAAPRSSRSWCRRARPA